MGKAAPFRIALFTAVAMVAFAANSLLCRMALAPGTIDAASFTSIRLASGALMLWLVASLARRRAHLPAGDWRAASMLFGYAILFSFAYNSLGAGTGALILFGAVQVTMFTRGLAAGEHFSVLAWCGLALAAGGLVYLVLPGVAAPPLVGALMMSGAGLAWGIYSLLGRGASDPLHASAGNFLLAVPLALAASALFTGSAHAEARGVALALGSGMLASGLGYVVWYAALRGLSATTAATVQLSVPAIAAAGGVPLLGEPLTPRLLVAAAATLGGIALVIAQRRRAR